MGTKFRTCSSWLRVSRVEVLCSDSTGRGARPDAGRREASGAGTLGGGGGVERGKWLRELGWGVEGLGFRV